MSDLGYFGLGLLFALMASCGGDGALIRNEQNSESRRSRESDVQAGLCHVYQSPQQVIVQCDGSVTICRARNNQLVCEDLTQQ
jgi:hypothetical protein